MILKKLIALVLVMILALFVVGCPKGIPQEDLTPLEKAQMTATWINDTYTAQYDDYQAMASRTDLTDAQKEILRVKYDILTEVDPLRKAFNEAIDDNLVPSRDLENKIMEMLNRLQSMTTQPPQSKQENIMNQTLDSVALL